MKGARKTILTLGTKILSKWMVDFMKLVLIFFESSVQLQIICFISFCLQRVINSMKGSSDIIPREGTRNLHIQHVMIS